MKDQNEPHFSPLSTRASRFQSPLHGQRDFVKKTASCSHPAFLEKDIEELQIHLREEKSMRIMLEKAMGRVSSTLSPGHRHFAIQTKELISEIELLEEEVANREQHVLSLYRSIFENSVSRPSSQQSSDMSSPAHHIKLSSRKHPSIISSAFCSSKKFPLQPLQTLVSVKDSSKRTSKSSEVSFLSGNSGMRCEKSRSALVQPCQKLPARDRTSVPRTLKEHLYQCPSKLSEEMVRCMATVYCGLRGAASANPERNLSPLLSRSSSNIVLPQHDFGEEQDCPCKSVLEISWISTDKNQLSRASCAINNYRILMEQLERVTVNQMENCAQTAFWINVYNALVMHAYLAYGIPHGSLRRLALFHKAAYNIGGYIISANAIEQSIFRFNTPRIGWWLETIISSALRKKSSEERQLIGSKFGLANRQPLVCFALCTGAFSDPVIRVYTASSVEEELTVAKRDFLQANVVVKKSRKVFLPKLLERFAREASIGSEDLLKWVTENVGKKLNDSIKKCIGNKSNKKVSQIIEWLPYSPKFRYVFSEDLTEKPWWV
ncbi:uncharacterized protein LOC119986493 isoform X2 [Tripterygium wilfordii]|nr:uncharacterized protein LOC119986493 isoform X2 [Tripterygium wilfordii]XP_038686987.1 uncharacterized protein LOC119986493 isoform X2 [Tripterygium wilfordii]XP_038686988.1 uncharacterized protein LOC119986493 isoform X2 [Tripterygium wilfordii]